MYSVCNLSEAWPRAKGVGASTVFGVLSCVSRFHRGAASKWMRVVDASLRVCWVKAGCGGLEGAAAGWDACGALQQHQ